MGQHTNLPGFNAVAWVISIAMIVLTIVVVYAAAFRPSPALGL